MKTELQRLQKKYAKLAYASSGKTQSKYMALLKAVTLRIELLKEGKLK